jgi:serine phosphatase RsbU (regulator of sigma subunit)/CHASE1-domain containing sensor protein
VVGLLVVALLAATVIAAISIYRSRDRSEQRDAQARAAQAVAAVQSAFGFAAASLQGADGLLRPDYTITRAAFHNYAADIIRNGVFPALAWVRAVPDPLRRTFEREIGHRTTEFRDGEFVPTGRRPVSFAVTYITPATAERKQAIGFDHLSDRLRGAAAKAARDTGRSRLTRPIRQLIRGGSAVSLYEPVYQPGLPLTTVMERRIALRGFVTGGIALAELATRVRSQLPPDANVRVSDGGSMLFGPREQDDPVGSTIVVAGRPWMISVEAKRSSPFLAALPIAGVGLSLIALVLLGASFAERRERTLREERERAERAGERDALVVRAADALERGLEIDDMLDDLAEVLVPEIADVCLVDLVEGRRLRRAGIAAGTPELEQKVRLVRAPTDAEEVLALAERSDGTFSSEFTRKHLWVSSEGDPGEMERRRAVGATQWLVVPLVARSRTLGTLVLAMVAESGRRFGPEDAALAREIARHAGLALDNQRLFEQQRDIAGTLQRALLPRRLPSPPRLDVAARYSPGIEGTEVGGDFYDVFQTDGSWLAVVGDVCGKGAEAAALTALARHTLRAVSDPDGPARALERLDEAIREEAGEMTFATVAVCALDTDGDEGAVRATFATGGHPPPLIARADGTVEEARPSGPFLGVLENPEFEQWETDLEAGATVLLYTDGVIEARADGEQFGDQRLKELFAGGSRLPLGGLLNRIEGAVVKFAHGEPQDDIALLALRARS